MPATIETPAGPVHAAFDDAPGSDVLVLLAPGAGGSLETPQIAAFAAGLASRGISAVRFNFPYIERGRKSPGSPKESVAAFRAVADAVRPRATHLVLGGKSYGGRMASHLAAEGYASGGLVFLGYPLHAPATPDRLRTEHLEAVGVPMLFLQGTRDKLADLELLRPLLARVRPQPSLHVVEEADHGFHVPKRTGRSDDDVLDELCATFAAWSEERITDNG